MTAAKLTPETLRPAQERPVFLAENGRRARMLRIAARVAVVLTVLWLTALAAGMLGFGHLPGTSIKQPFSRLISGGGDAPKQQVPSTDLASVTASGLKRSADARAQAAVAKRRALARTAAIRARSPLRPAPAQPSGRRAVVAQQPRQQGWTRQGFLAPPGQIRKAEPPAPRPAPPGQAKKSTPPPPPPPPPGHGNGNGGGNPKQL